MPFALSVRVVWVDLGGVEGAQLPSFSVFQGIDFFSAGDPRDNVLCTAVIRSYGYAGSKQQFLHIQSAKVTQLIVNINYNYIV